MASEGAALYCVADAGYFLGAVALVNSLRLHGHGEPIYLLDLGLEREQRALLEGEVRLVEAPPGVAPWLAKTIAPLRHPHETMVLIDADMICTRPLGELIERAAAGRVIVFENNADRHVAEWGELLGLGAIRRLPYACSGLILAGGEIGARTLELVDRGQGEVEISKGFYGADLEGYPFRFPEQDVLNAVLASERTPPEAVEILPLRLAPVPPFEGLRLRDERALRCSYADGAEPFVVHHYLRKPWLERTHYGVFARMLRRSLVGPGLAIEVPRERVPAWFADGLIADARRRLANIGFRLHWHLLEPLAARRAARRGAGGA